MVPSTVGQQQVFGVVVNGNLSHCQLSEEFLSPLCPEFSTEEMQRYCDSSLARKRRSDVERLCRLVRLRFQHDPTCNKHAKCC